MDVGDFMIGSMQEHFIHFGNIIKDKVHKRCPHIIWLATTWSLWRMQNNFLFQGGSVNLSLLLNQIKFMFWFWFTGRVCNNVDIEFLAWCNNLLACFQNM
jgi:hypothetical protein